MFDYPTVTIDSQPYTVYGDLDDANLYLDASIAATGWQDATDVVKSRALVSATRWLDSVAWQGTKTESDQDHAFPRTGLTSVDVDTLPQLLINSSFELAALMVDTPDLRASLQAPLAKALRAGSAHIEYFRPIDVQALTPFPQVVMSLVGQWLSAASAAKDVQAFGTDAVAGLNKPFDFSHGI